MLKTDYRKQFPDGNFFIEEIVKPEGPEEVTSHVQKESCQQISRADLVQGFSDITSRDLCEKDRD
jgi:hypothetical protein